jgi:hypothetical protein
MEVGDTGTDVPRFLATYDAYDRASGWQWFAAPDKTMNRPLIAGNTRHEIEQQPFNTAVTPVAENLALQRQWLACRAQKSEAIGPGQLSLCTGNTYSDVLTGTCHANRLADRNFLVYPVHTHLSAP